MRKLLLITLLLVSFGALAQIDKAIPARPNPPVLYNDFTKGGNFLNATDAALLERKLVAYDDTTSNQIAIVIVEDLQGYDANQFATAIGDKWGVGGSEQFDNGIVILISTGGGDGNRDAYIATGRGMEGVIPDMVAASIVDHELIPYFKQGNYAQGLNATVDAILKAAAGEYKAPENYRSSRSKKPFTPGILVIVAIVAILIFSFLGGGGPGGTYMSGRGYRGWRGGGWSGGGWSGGGWSGGGGSSGGGGFGGFGGGSFGGGGAGGKW